MAQFIPGSEVFIHGIEALRSDIRHDPMESIDLSSLKVPAIADETELCSEVTALLDALGVEMGPTRVADGSKIRMLMVAIPFTESGVTEAVDFALLAERNEIVFGSPPRAGVRPSDEQMAENPEFMELIRDAAVAKLFEVGS